MITMKEISEIMSYDKETGVFTSKVTRGKRKIGAALGTVSHCSCKKYLSIPIGYKRYYAHRLAWFIVYGEWPDGEIDHIDGNGMNNKISNLRCVPRSHNARNMKLFATNKSGVAGVHFCNTIKRWVARIVVDQRTINLGTSRDLEKAVTLRKAAEVKYGFHKNHGRATEFVD